MDLGFVIFNELKGIIAATNRFGASSKIYFCLNFKSTASEAPTAYPAQFLLYPNWTRRPANFFSQCDECPKLFG